MPLPATESSIPTAPTQPSPIVQSSGTSTDPQNWNDWFWQNSTTLLLAVLAAWAGYIALRTLAAIRDQARIASNAITKLERPWIFVQLEKIEFLNSHDQYTIRVFLRRRNVGRSPAWIVTGAIATKKLSDSESLPTVPDYSEGRAYSGPAPIAQSEELATSEERFFLDEEEWVQFALGKLKLILFGEVNYRDNLGTEDLARHVTRFCICLAHPLNDPFPDKPVIVTTSNYWYFGGPEGYNTFT